MCLLRTFRGCGRWWYGIRQRRCGHSRFCKHSAIVRSVGTSGSACGNGVCGRASAGVVAGTSAFKACWALSSPRSDSAGAEEIVHVICSLSVTSSISSSSDDPEEEAEDEADECTGVCSTGTVGVGGGCGKRSSEHLVADFSALVSVVVVVDDAAVAATWGCTGAGFAAVSECTD